MKRREDMTRQLAEIIAEKREVERGERDGKQGHEPVAVQPARKERWYERLIRRKQRQST